MSTEENTHECSVVARSEETKQYSCGHDGPAEYAHILSGVTYEVDHTKVDQSKCGQCHLDEIESLITQCAKCKKNILPGHGCIMYEQDLCCLAVACGPGPMGHMPGVWDGQQFIDAFAAGTARLL